MENETQIIPSPKRELRVVEDAGPLQNLFDTARFEHLLRIASVMAGASLIPDHMWKDKSGNLPPDMVKGNCFLVVNQAIRWGMDPFAVVPETYVVGGKLGFQGKLVAAVINSRAPITGPLDYEFSGAKGSDSFTVRVFATIKGESKPREIKLSVGDAKTDNSMWKKDPEQKLVYSGATKWARRHCPEVILGVLTEDDLEIIAQQEKNITPAPRARVPKEDKGLPAPETTSMTAASGGDSPQTASTAAESVKTNADTAQPSSDQSDDAKLFDMMKTEGITNTELVNCLARFGERTPKNFEGPQDLSNKALEYALANWPEMIKVIKAERAP